MGSRSHLGHVLSLSPFSGTPVPAPSYLTSPSHTSKPSIFPEKSHTAPTKLEADNFSLLLPTPISALLSNLLFSPK